MVYVPSLYSEHVTNVRAEEKIKIIKAIVTQRNTQSKRTIERKKKLLKQNFYDKGLNYNVVIQKGHPWAGRCFKL